MATDRDFDLFVIGGGSGGVRAARMAAAGGVKVAIVDADRYGGTCVIRGCVPKKLFSYAAHFHEDFEDAAGFGWSVGESRFDWARLVANKDAEIARLEGIYERLLRESGVVVMRGQARLLDPHRVEIGKEIFSSETILLATGAHPVFPAGHGWDLAVSSNELFHLKTLPRRALVYGGGYIAVEFASIFNGLGVAVIQVYRGAQILRGFDDDVRETLAAEMTKKGVEIRVEQVIERIERRKGHLAADLSDGSVIETDLVLAATGRRPNSENLGLAAAHVACDDSGAIRVDAYSRTTQPNIYAVGDVTDRMALTPVAIEEAMAFVDTVYHGRPRAIDYETVPTAIFSHPTVSTIGLSEREARRRFGAVDIYRSAFRPLKHTLSGRDERAMIKLVVARESQKVVGAHMVGADAPEIIQGVAIAIAAGATKAVFDATVGIHPTVAEEFVTLRQPLPEPDRKAAE